jgi:hypothetical protein
VRGTGTAFDQTYYPDAITRHMSMTDGYDGRERQEQRACQPGGAVRGLLNAMRCTAPSRPTTGPDARRHRGSYNPADYCAKVQIEPEGAVTGWLPVLSPWVGNGWGLFAPVTPGDQVDVQFVDGDFTQGYVVPALLHRQRAAAATCRPASSGWCTRAAPSSSSPTTARHRSPTRTAPSSPERRRHDLRHAGTWTHRPGHRRTGKINGTVWPSVAARATVTGNVAVTSGNVTADGGLKTTPPTRRAARSEPQ